MELKDEEIKSRMEQIKKSLKETALGINYIDAEYKKKFTELAKKEYGDNYGVALKELIKIYEGFYPKGNEEILAKIDILANEIEQIKSQLSQPKEIKGPPNGYIYSADGSRLIKKS